MLESIKTKLYNLFHPQPSFRNPEKWQRWFVASSLRTLKNCSPKITAAEERKYRREKSRLNREIAALELKLKESQNQRKL